MTSILHIIPTLEGGGAERQLASLAVEQQRDGLDVHIGLRRGGVHAKTLEGSGVKLHLLGDYPAVDPRLSFSITRLIRRVRPSIVQTWLVSMDITAGLAATMTRTPWILSERNSIEFYRTLGRVGSIRARVARYADAIISNSEGGRDYWAQAIPRSRNSNLFVVHNALDVDRIRATPASPETFSNPLLLVVGRFSPEKATDVIIDGIAKAAGANFQAVMIGEGPLRAEIDRTIDAQHLRERVSLRPYQPDWWGWLKRADVLVSMSRFEGNPNVALEAMAAGCPVILSDIAAHREIADDTSAIFVPMDDAGGLARAIQDTLSRPDAATRRAEIALKRSGTMTFEAAAASYRAIYDGLIDMPRPVT